MSNEQGKLPEVAELAVENLQVGDKVDLNSCPFLKERASADFEYAVVESVERETPACVAVSYQDHGVVGYPIGCKLKVSSETLADRKLQQVGPMLDYFIADKAEIPHVGICLDDEDRATLVSWDLPAGAEERSNLELLVIGVVNAANVSGVTTVSGLLAAGATHCSTRRIDGRMNQEQQSVYDRLMAAAVESGKLPKTVDGIRESLASLVELDVASGEPVFQPNLAGYAGQAAAKELIGNWDEALRSDPNGKIVGNLIGDVDDTIAALKVFRDRASAVLPERHQAGAIVNLPETFHHAAGVAHFNGQVMAAAKVIATLDKAESFIVGFEGDELQEGIDDLLREIRTASGAFKAQWKLPEAEQELGEDEIRDFLTDRIERGDMALEDVTKMMARYGLMDPKAFQVEMRERMQNHRNE